MAAFNLLPSELRTTGKVLALVRNFKHVLIIGLVVFIVLVGATVAYLTKLSGDRQELLVRQDALEAQVQSLESTEQRLVLIKDRIAKAEQVMAYEDVSEEVDGFESVYGLVKDEFKISQLEVELTKLSFDLEGDNSEDVRRVVGEILASGLFTDMKLLSYDYTSTNGYQLVLDIATEGSVR